MFMYEIILTAVTVFVSTVWFLLLHKKTRISLSHLYKDNLIVIALSLTALFLSRLPMLMALALSTVCVFGFLGLLFVIRFYRYPLRRRILDDTSVVSPDDGNVIYIKKIESGQIPMSVKNGVSASLDEFSGIELTCPCWIIGINMTPFDVHRNSCPISGKIIMSHHIDGVFKSLKDPDAYGVNERNSTVFDNGKFKVGVVQTASRLVRRIVSYRQQGDVVNQGDWFGMIKFGSQVDVIIPCSSEIKVYVGEQVYTRKTILAKVDE